MKKIGDCKWLIEKEGKMRVPGIIYVSDKLYEAMQSDNSIEQVRNVAHLPGIQKYSLAMPDIHWGYGFPIGGVAAMDAEEGVISPGGVGYDINCLPADTSVLTSLGYRKKISEVTVDDKVVVINNKTSKPTDVILTLKRREKILYNLTTASGLQISASPDHPILTRNGMIESKNLSVGDEVAVHPFKGIEYEEPQDFEIVSEEGFNDGIRKELLKRNILSLKFNNPKLPYLLKIFGYLIGDGTVYDKNVIFYGKKNDLKDIKEDIKFIGYNCSIYERKRFHDFKGYKFETTETSLKVSARSLVHLLWAMGYPKGNKIIANLKVPLWVFKLPLWMKRLFLASYFGAEMSKPSISSHYNFYMPEIKLSRRKPKRDFKFLEDLKVLLKEFNINSTIKKASETENKTIFRLLIYGDTKNLLNLWSKINFGYNKKRKRLAIAGIVYLKLKQDIIQKREEIRTKIKTEKKWRDRNEIFKEYEGMVNRRFIERSLYGTTNKARPPQGFIRFEEFLKDFTEGELVYDKIVDIRLIEHNDIVYDFTVKNKHHNFVADGVVVSNCGVRVIRTSLVVAELKGKIELLTNKIYSVIPCGVGSESDVNLSLSTLKNVLKDGSSWAVKNGFGWEEDLEYTEENGRMEGVNPEIISNRALERGKQQLGTLGSGNHFIEIQKVSEIFDKKAADAFGLDIDSITVMIHTGSRGLGHQICSDWVKNLMKTKNKFNIEIPDEQLICAPFDSKEGQEYLFSMRAAANFAWANRQIILARLRESFSEVFGKSEESLGMNLIYDVAHNIAKVENHTVDGKIKKLCVHRKGATRAFPPGHPDIPSKYAEFGQPVLIPGDMGTASYILLGTQKAMEETFGSTCHGAGRVLSRKKAMYVTGGRNITTELKEKGIYVRAKSIKTIREEAPEAYKDIDEVVNVVERAGLSKRVVKMVPLAVVKG